ncbi:MAG TPA: phosphoribosyltransferase family protein [Thermoanaerobaculia bacterium]|nr:phosphoribosyltransferase family protein [Thermoanaerobaculia bacterium]
MAEIRPRKIQGAWTDGYVLDLHSTGSTFLGHNELGHPEFETHRTEMGELLYRLKYRSEAAALTDILVTAEEFIRSWGVTFSMIVPVPPSAQRRVQPVFQVAEGLGARFGVPVKMTAIQKSSRNHEQLKNVYDFDERRLLLDGAFAVSRSEVEGRRILLLDDLYRSGATLNAVAEALTNAGAAAVYALALTKTRRNA